MSEFEDKLNTILNDSDAMGRIMALAQSLGSGQSSSSAPPPSTTENSTTQHESSAFIGNLDPRILSMIVKILGAYNSEDDDRANLLTALRPFVRKERQDKLAQAIQVSKITRAIRTALNAFHSDEEEITNV